VVVLLRLVRRGRLRGRPNLTLRKPAGRASSIAEFDAVQRAI